jgi:tetratricopeptide (TPR) repeat protein
MISVQNLRQPLSGNSISIMTARALIVFFGVWVTSVQDGSAQVNYQRQYASAKMLFKEGRYNLAMESFKSLIQYDVNNPFSEYASFFYALSAYHQGYRSVAKDMLIQVKTLYPAWEQLDEVNLWLAKIHFDGNDYFQALQVLSQIKSGKLTKETTALKQKSLAPLTDAEILKRMFENYPNDEVIGERLARVIAKSALPEDKALLDKLILAFKLKKSDFVDEVPPTIYKDVYSISLLFPFMVSTLEPTPLRKRNQFVLDLYEGMKLAVDTLAKQGVKISLRAYDTERNPEKIKDILKKDELRNTDLIVGPLFQEENNLVQGFSQSNRINLFNPVSNNFDLVKDNPYGFLFQPSLESLGSNSAEFLDSYKQNKKCIVFFGETRRDSVLAMSFLKRASSTNLSILQIERVSRAESGKIMTILATPTEFDEFKYPKQFSLPKDSLGCIFVASDDPLIYTKVISSVETRKDSVTILGSEAWLDQTAVDFEKYQQLGIVLFASNYTASTNEAYQAFQRKFIRVHGRVSSANSYSDYAKLGYEFMLFVGNALHRHGVYFQDAFGRQKFSGYLTEGYDFQNARDNQLVPFVRFRSGVLTLIDKK